MILLCLQLIDKKTLLLRMTTGVHIYYMLTHKVRLYLAAHGLTAAKEGFASTVFMNATMEGQAAS